MKTKIIDSSTFNRELRMINEEVENMLLSVLDNIDTSSYDFSTSYKETNSKFFHEGVQDHLTLYFQKPSGELSVEFIYNSISDSLTFRTRFTDISDEDEDFDMISYEQKIPRTEEQYFQYDTIQDNFFSLDFYILLENTMKKLLNKYRITPKLMG